MPLVTVNICTRGRSTDLRNTLESLQQVTLPAGLRAELLLIENGPPEGIEGVAAALRTAPIPVRYLHEPRPGKSHALNRAVAAAAGEIVVFTDDDIRFPRDWLARLCAPILADEADAVAGAVVLAPHLLRPWMHRLHRAWLASTADYLSPTAPSEMCGANMAIRRSALQAVGGFDPELGPGVTGGGEESLLSWQLRAAGFRLAGAPAVQVIHHLNPDRLTYGAWVKAAAGKGQARAYLLHHWHHQTLPLARLRLGYLQLKCRLRCAATSRRAATDEGITAWELSYREEIATYRRYLFERRRPRHYTLHGLHRITPEPSPAA